MVRFYRRDFSHRRVFRIFPSYARFKNERSGLGLRGDHRECSGADLIALDYPGSTCGGSVLASDLAAICTGSLVTYCIFDACGDGDWIGAVGH
jgi:hypothetical protein